MKELINIRCVKSNIYTWKYANAVWLCFIFCYIIFWEFCIIYFIYIIFFSLTPTRPPNLLDFIFYFFVKKIKYMDSNLFWPTIPEQRASSRMWLIYTMSHWWRNMIFSLLAPVNFKYLLGYGGNLCLLSWIFWSSVCFVLVHILHTILWSLRTLIRVASFRFRWKLTYNLIRVSQLETVQRASDFGTLSTNWYVFITSLFQVPSIYEEEDLERF